MAITMTATYLGGKLLLDDIIPDIQDRQKVNITINHDELVSEDLNKSSRRKKFIENADIYSFNFPDDFKFNRDEANER